MSIKYVLVVYVKLLTEKKRSVLISMHLRLSTGGMGDKTYRTCMNTLHYESYINFLLVHETFLHYPLYGVHISKFLHFSYISDFNNRNQFLTALLKQVYR